MIPAAKACEAPVDRRRPPPPFHARRPAAGAPPPSLPGSAGCARFRSTRRLGIAPSCSSLTAILARGRVVGLGGCKVVFSPLSAAAAAADSGGKAGCWGSPPANWWSSSGRGIPLPLLGGGR
uniref:Uncharacterized protein n=1 Tax=Oryza barthii TaxID=65489 RepID=A0A0D3HMY3_9ORYZ